VDLERVNIAFIFLLPKKPGATTPGDHRPICLQNCPMKIIAKILTARLQVEIPKLIDLDQTGFIKGRSISENIYALKLVQHCHKQRLPTLVLKLVFAKAFDSVNWDSLLKILQCRGFPPTWCSWIQHILTTSKSAILLNGCPCNWFACKKGLRQGDPMSPYLFLLVADILQRLIKTDGAVRHPASDALPCPVIQYADDTLIVLRAANQDVQRLKQLLDQFANATGLKINFHKSTVVPMHVPELEMPSYLAALGCRRDQFPQTYLGMPLSNVKRLRPAH